LEFEHDELKQSILGLLKLQEIDGALFKLRAEVDSPDPAYTTAENKVLAAKKAHSVVERAFREIERERRALELRNITLQEDVKKAEVKRREVRNTKEDFSAGKEVENFQKRLIELKKLLQEKEVQAQERSAAVEEKKKALDEAEAGFASLKEAREKTLSESSQKTADLMKEREAHIANVNEMIFSMYERVQKLRKGSGVALVKAGICNGCFVAIPPQLQSELKKLKSLITCSSCSRILFPEEEFVTEDSDGSDSSSNLAHG